MARSSSCTKSVSISNCRGLYGLAPESQKPTRAVKEWTDTRMHIQKHLVMCTLWWNAPTMPQPGTRACLLCAEQGKGLASLSRRSQGALSQGVSIHEEETELLVFAYTGQSLLNTCMPCQHSHSDQRLGHPSELTYPRLGAALPLLWGQGTEAVDMAVPVSSGTHSLGTIQSLCIHQVFLSCLRLEEIILFKL